MVQRQSRKWSILGRENRVPLASVRCYPLLWFEIPEVAVHGVEHLFLRRVSFYEPGLKPSRIYEHRHINVRVMTDLRVVGCAGGYVHGRLQ